MLKVLNSVGRASRARGEAQASAYDRPFTRGGRDGGGRGLRPARRGAGGARERASQAIGCREVVVREASAAAHAAPARAGTQAPIAPFCIVEYDVYAKMCTINGTSRNRN